MVSANKFIENFVSAIDFQDPIEVTLDTELKSMPEWGSLAALSTIVMFDMDYGQAITGEDIKKCTSVGDIYALIQ